MRIRKRVNLKARKIKGRAVKEITKVGKVGKSGVEKVGNKAKRKALHTFNLDLT